MFSERQIIFILIGITLISLGLFLAKFNNNSQSEIEIINSPSKTIIIEITGSVVNPGVYEFDNNSRVKDALAKAGGLSEDANQEWIELTLNQAALLVDGQKIYIPSKQSNQENANISEGNMPDPSTLGETISNKININSASQKELESLWGIGPVTAQNIIEQRPYSSVQDLLLKKILKQNVFERNQNLLTVY